MQAVRLLLLQDEISGLAFPYLIFPLSLSAPSLLSLLCIAAELRQLPDLIEKEI